MFRGPFVHPAGRADASRSPCATSGSAVVKVDQEALLVFAQLLKPPQTFHPPVREARHAADVFPPAIRSVKNHVAVHRHLDGGRG